MIISRLVRVAGFRRNIVLACTLSAAFGLAAQDDVPPGSFDLGGTQRTRYETLDGQFRTGLDASDRALALQTSLRFDWRHANLQVFGEILDARVGLDDLGSFVSTSHTNTLEPVQAYVSWRRESSATPGRESTLRVGRMTLDVGKRRLVARSRFRNTVDSFAGVDWEWHDANGRAARAFYFKPMNIQPADRASLLDGDFELDRGMRRNELLGLYYHLAPFENESALELYAFEHRLRPTAEPDASADLLSTGARVYRTAEPGRINYELEAVVQRGSSGGVVAGVSRPDLEHRAHFLHFEIGYELAARGSPNVVFQYDLASGDENPADGRNERFDTLFGDRSFEYGPTGLYGAIARGNLRSPGVRVTFRPHPRLRSVVACRRVRLDERRDAWVGSGRRDPSGASGGSVGRHFEASVTWTAIEDRLQIDAGVARLEAGSFLARVAGTEFNGSPRYFYLGATTTF